MLNHWQRHILNCRKPFYKQGDDKLNAIVTGAGRCLGIGAKIACTLAEMGTNVYLTSFDTYDISIGQFSATEYLKTIKKCREYGVKVYYSSYDLTSQSNISALFDDANSKLGPINILINNLCYHVIDSFGEIDEESLSSALNTNAKATLLLCQEFYRRHCGNFGRIINLASTQNLEPLTHEIAYAVSKASIPVITSTLAPIMAAKGITINGVNPGATDIGDLKSTMLDKYRKCNGFGRIGATSDVANLVIFLLSDSGKWITGQTINSEGALLRGTCEFPKDY